MRARRPAPAIALLIGGVALAALGSCRNDPAADPSPVATATASPRLPLPPPTEAQDLGPDQPPVIWIAGVLTDVADARLEIREASGSVVTLQRLGQGATSFFRVSEGRWLRLAPEAEVPAGQPACVETLLDGSSLLALRVFLGAGCGPG